MNILKIYLKNVGRLVFDTKKIIKFNNFRRVVVIRRFQKIKIHEIESTTKKKSFTQTCFNLDSDRVLLYIF